VTCPMPMTGSSMTKPKVSLGLPVYNGGLYLENALATILQQDFEDFELIICDNASTDATSDICRSFAGKDDRIRYFRNEKNIGLGANHNKTFEFSRGQYFKWVAHDDDYPGAMLGRFVRVMEESPSYVSLVYSLCEYIDESGNVLTVDSDSVNSVDPSPHKRLLHMLRKVRVYNCIYGMFRSDFLRKTRRHGHYPGADHILVAELAMLGLLVEIPEPLLRIREHRGRTYTAYKDPGDLRELFTPGMGHKYSPFSIKARMELELVRSALQLPIPLKDKLLCTAVAALYPRWRSFRNFGGRQKRRLFAVFPSLKPAPRDGGGPETVRKG
jgi:glycosyltransferase involved in cell wall biosynthesis